MFGWFKSTNDLVVYEADYGGSEGTVEACATVTNAKSQREMVEALKEYEFQETGEEPKKITLKSVSRY